MTDLPVRDIARALVFDPSDRLLLIAYEAARDVDPARPGLRQVWVLPGGGIEPGENAPDAMLREFREEAEIVPSGALRLHGFYRNAAAAGRDHVALYVAPAFSVLRRKAPDREIAECGFFPLDALPEETTRATRDRLAEIREGRPPAALW